MLRKILSVVIGMTAAIAVIMLVQGGSMAAFPLPAGVDIRNPASINPGDIPLVNLVSVLSSYILAAMAAGAVAAKVDRSYSPTNGLIVGGLLTLASISNLAMIPHPLWFAVINVVAMIPLAWLGAYLVTRAPSA